MNKNIIKRVLSYILGLFLLAVGVTISIKSNLGVSPVNSLPYMLSQVTGLDQGMFTIIVFSFFILLQFIIIGKDFKPINILQIVFSTMFGYFVNFTNSIFAFIPSPNNYFIQLIYLILSIVVVALGLLFYLNANIVPQPAEGLMIAIADKTKTEMPKIKVIVDSIIVLCAIGLSFFFFQELVGIREGTIIAAIMIGKVLGILSKKFKEPLQKYLMG